MQILKKTILVLSATLALASAANAQEWRHHGGGYGHYRGYDGGYRHHGGGGGDLAAGIFGLAAGAIIAGAMSANEEPRRVVSSGGDRNWVAHCARRYRSYDAYSNTFVGNDGYRHECR